MKRYTAGAELFILGLIASFVFLSSALWNEVNAAVWKQYPEERPPIQVFNFSCDGVKLVFNKRGAEPIIASVGTENGTWIEIPKDVPDQSLFFFNVDSGKVGLFALVESGGVKQPIFSTYKDTKAFNAKQAQMKLRCRKA